jgi:hypothetical protein
VIIVSEAIDGTTWPEIPERWVVAPGLRIQPLHESWAAPSVPPWATLSESSQRLVGKRALGPDVSRGLARHFR